MDNRIAVIDYGIGNLHSLKKALEFVGGEVLVTADPQDLRSAARIVLPGIGAFGEGMDNLRKSGMEEVLREEIIEQRKPFLGICLGLQLLADRSFEFGEHQGLGFIPGRVRKFDFKNSGAGELRVPHVGWNSLEKKFEHPLLSGVPNGANFYFVHSFHFVPEDNKFVLAIANYGYDFPAIIGYDNIFATQFHPEKSQKDGLRILENFISWNPKYAEN